MQCSRLHTVEAPKDVEAHRCVKALRDVKAVLASSLSKALSSPSVGVAEAHLEKKDQLFRINVSS